jgi:hypothetical protein
LVSIKGFKNERLLTWPSAARSQSLELTMAGVSKIEHTGKSLVRRCPLPIRLPPDGLWLSIRRSQPTLSNLSTICPSCGHRQDLSYTYWQGVSYETESGNCGSEIVGLVVQQTVNWPSLRETTLRRRLFPRNGAAQGQASHANRMALAFSTSMTGGSIAPIHIGI